MKTFFRLALAGGLAGAVFLATNSNTDVKAAENPAAQSSLQQDEVYQFATGHPLAGQTRTRQQIEDNNLCPGSQDVCATSVDNPTLDPIMWDSPQNKF